MKLESMKKTAIYLVLILLAFAGCKKYDEGPMISFRSKEKRLLGTWRIEHYFVNGYDSSNYFTQYDNPLIDFDADWVYITIQDLYTLQPKKHKLAYGEWSWENDMNNILMIFHDLPNPEDEWLIIGPFNTNEPISWEIKKLKSKELILETTYSNVLYRLEFGRLDIKNSY